MKEQVYYEQIGVAMTSRSFAEYERMFVFEPEQLIGKRVLDVAGGASSFTAESRQLGILSEAADPLYELSAPDIGRHGREEIELVAAKMKKLTHVYNWAYYGSVEKHKANRVESLEKFLQDFSSPEASSRYTPSALPSLPYHDDSFDLVLCSHFLFLYEEQFDYSFHSQAVRELIRVCRPGGEVRVYPLLNFKTNEYERMPDLIADIERCGAIAERKKSQLPFLPHSDQYLCIRKMANSPEANHGSYNYKA